MIYHFYLKKLKVEELEKLAANLHDEKEYAHKKFKTNIKILD